MRIKLLATVTCCLLLTLAANSLRADELSDGTTSLKVQLALLDKLGRDGLRVHVETTGGDVHLTGTVQKRETSELADSVAKSVAGVTSVHNDIQLAGTKNEGKPERAANETEAEMRDLALKSKVRLALIDKLGSDGLHIGTDVANGVVSLEVPPGMTDARRADAKAAAGAVSGVKKVITVDKH